MAPGGVTPSDKKNEEEKPSGSNVRPEYNRTVSVEDVSGQAPDIVKSFLATCFEKDGLKVPEELTAEQHKVNKQVANVLREIGDSLNQHPTLNTLIDEIHVTKDTAFDTFLSVAMQIFQDGKVNWGRVVTLFYFGYKLAIQVLTQIPLIKMIIEWVVKFIKEKLVQWIAEQGGWEAIMDYFKTLKNRHELEFKFVVATCVTVITLVYLWNRR
ncbi:apoptosis regulator BAX-like [Actinia tenebrosa]|uniref:Apoptosis regulator BAX-like n=1 Tax=Actinia tenebrosa TaxID=6105 RepID=A0A6P8H834_ACTTE|nr:apoptosis regulator BAX-like [Actinia tenebrosa]